MSVGVKACFYVDDQALAKGQIETRRFNLTAKNLRHFEPNFIEVIQEKFPSLAQHACAFKVFWKDEDGDDIIISSDEELSLAIKMAGDETFKIFITLDPLAAPPLPPQNQPMVNPQYRQNKAFSGGAHAAYVESISPEQVQRNRFENRGLDRPLRNKLSTDELVKNFSEILSMTPSQEPRFNPRHNENQRGRDDELLGASAALLSDAEKLLQLKQMIQNRKRMAANKLSAFEERQRLALSQPELNRHSFGQDPNSFNPPQYHQGFKRGNFNRGRGGFNRGVFHHQGHPRKQFEDQAQLQIKCDHQNQPHKHHHHQNQPQKCGDQNQPQKCGQQNQQQKKKKKQNKDSTGTSNQEQNITKPTSGTPSGEQNVPQSKPSKSKTKVKEQ